MSPNAAAVFCLLLLTRFFLPSAHASDRPSHERLPQVGASGRPVLLAYGHETREVYRCLRSPRSGAGHYTDLDCPAQLPLRVATLVWLSRMGSSGGGVGSAAVQPPRLPLFNKH